VLWIVDVREGKGEEARMMYLNSHVETSVSDEEDASTFVFKT